MTDDIISEVTELTKAYPRFSDGRIDYTNERACPVVNCSVVYEDEVLLAYRSKDVVAYPETWNGISGFIDELKPLEEIVRQELHEEMNIGTSDIERIVVRSKIIQIDADINREWHVFPALVVLKRKPELTTNWENKTAKWVRQDDVLGLDLMPGFAESYKNALGLVRVPKILRRTVFGDPILRENARRLSKAEIASSTIQTLIADMFYTVRLKKTGVGLAAPQVGESVALSVIAIKATPNRPSLTPFETVIINPEIVETFGRRQQMWEGCISCGEGRHTLYAKVPRYKKVKLRWLDDRAVEHEEILEGMQAHVAQHEVDHLDGILFVDRVRDTSTFMMQSEFRKRIVGAKAGSRRK